MQSDQPNVYYWIYINFDSPRKHKYSLFLFLSLFPCTLLSFLFILSIFHKRFSSCTSNFTSCFYKKSADQIIFDSLHSIFTIGICIMIFSIGASLISVLPFPFFIKQVLIAIFEITNAVSYFGTMQISSYHKIILLCMITSFGGLSAAAQTISVCKKADFPSGNICLLNSYSVYQVVCLLPYSSSEIKSSTVLVLV